MLGGALQTDTAGHNNYTVIGAPTTGTQNGHATTIFNGTTDRLNLASFSLGASAVTVMLAAKVISSDATSRQIFTLSNGTNQMLLGAKSGKATINDGGAETSGTVTVAGAWKRLGVTWTNGTPTGVMKLYVNGVNDASGAGTVADNLPSQVANYFSFCNVEIGEILVFNAVLSSTDLTNVDNYLSTKWAI